MEEEKPKPTHPEPPKAVPTKPEPATVAPKEVSLQKGINS